MIAIHTRKSIDAIASGEIFAQGFGTHPRVRQEPIKWLAVRGGGPHDWAIYCGPLDWSDEEIRRRGDKISGDDVIQYLVPCSAEANGDYRR